MRKIHYSIPRCGCYVTQVPVTCFGFVINRRTRVVFLLVFVPLLRLVLALVVLVTVICFCYQVKFLVLGCFGNGLVDFVIYVNISLIPYFFFLAQRRCT